MIINEWQLRIRLSYAVYQTATFMKSAAASGSGDCVRVNISITVAVKIENWMTTCKIARCMQLCQYLKNIFITAFKWSKNNAWHLNESFLENITTIQKFVRIGSLSGYLSNLICWHEKCYSSTQHFLVLSSFLGSTTKMKVDLFHCACFR